MEAQVLDSMDIERERGITIKAQSVSLHFKARDGKTYLLNFIDTPGHVDFSYEVSRSLAACEGAILVVDAAQGVEAQTVAVCYTAIDQSLDVLPVLNKIDLPQAEPERVIAEIEDIIGVDAHDAIRASAKSGFGVEDVLEAIVTRIRPPQGELDAPLQALIIDSWFDSYLGVVSLVRIMHGTLLPGQKMQVMSTGKSHIVDQVGVFTPKRTPTESLKAGEVGYVIAGIKEIQGAPVGDTLTLEKNPASSPLPGFKRVKPQVYAGLFPISSEDFEAFREALAKLSLNDASLFYEPESSEALGFGFRCGFLGMLHMEIVQERLEREYNLELISTSPTVIYKIMDTKGATHYIDNPSRLPPVQTIQTMFEPIVRANILVPQDYLGPIITLCIERRGVQIAMMYSGRQVSVTYDIPMSEVVSNFFDRLKSVSRGYASLDYNFIRFEEADLVKMDILINNERVDALSVIVHRTAAQHRGRAITDKMRELIPRQMFDVAIQAALGGHIIARQSVKALRKNVTAKCYGGDVSRKRKLLEKQKAGKKRMKQVGHVEIPQEAFMAVFQADHKK